MPQGTIPQLRPRRPTAAGPPLAKPGQFDMAAHRERFGKVWGAEAKRASARLRKERYEPSVAFPGVVHNQGKP